MSKFTIGIVDDHEIVRQGLKELLHKVGPYKVTCEFESGKALLDALPLDNAPQLFIIDYSMPGMDGIQVIKELEESGQDYKTLLLTQYMDEHIIDAAYHYGARGFLDKNCTAGELRAAIDNIAKTGYNNVTEILKRIRRYDPSASKTSKDAIALTSREQEFLRLVCDEGEFTYEQMADLMNVSVKSVEAYRTALFEKYNIRSKVGLVLFSYRHRLTEPFS